MNEQEQLTTIRRELNIVSAHISEASKIAKPFRRSKFLNMLYKEVKQLQIEVSVFLGDAEIRLLETSPETVTNLSSYQILKAMKRDHELPRQDKDSPV
jgi:hypothetical protein